MNDNPTLVTDIITRQFVCIIVKLIDLLTLNCNIYITKLKPIKPSLYTIYSIRINTDDDPYIRKTGTTHRCWTTET